MPQVNFYILHTLVKPEKARFACQLTDKAWQQGYRIYLQTNSLIEAQQLDDLLWTFKQDSFIPHGVDSGVLHSNVPVYIGYQQEYRQEMDLLINLTEVVLPHYQQFKRIAEIVEETARESGRVRYRFYRDQGCDLLSHDIYR
jgi:DNA polymerase-3 subunit chi